MTVEYYEVYDRFGELVAAFKYLDHAELYVMMILLNRGRIERKTKTVNK